MTRPTINPPGPLLTFELLYCYGIIIGQQLSDIRATGLTLAKKRQQRRLRQLEPNGVRTCGMWCIFILGQLDVATLEGSSLLEVEGVFPKAEHLNTALNLGSFPLQQSFTLRQHVGVSLIDI